MFLEDGDFTSADQYCEKVLDMNPMCAEAYLGKALAALKIKNIQEIYNINDIMVEDMIHIKKAMNFGTNEFKEKLILALNTNKEKVKQERIRQQEAEELYKQNWLSNALKTRKEMYTEYKSHYKAKTEMLKKLQKKYPIPKMPDDLEGSSVDKVYAFIVSTYSGLSEADISNYTKIEDIRRILKKLMYQRKIEYIEGLGYVGMDIIGMYY